MRALLVDTDVASFLFKPDTRAKLYEPHLRGSLPFVSFMTVAELEQWALLRNWGTARKARLEAHLQQFTLIPFDRPLCRQWAEVRYEGKTKGRKIETGDAWIAATALLYKLPLVTHNRAHFDWIGGLTVISEA
jgi:tRNA(fMet)-specific endonuclease VapC